MIEAENKNELYRDPRELAPYACRQVFLVMKVVLLILAGLALTVFVVLAMVKKSEIFTILAIVSPLFFVLTLIIWGKIVRAREVRLESEYLTALLASGEDKSEYELCDMDTGAEIKINELGMTVNGRFYYHEHFDVLLASANVKNRASFAIFIESTLSPFVDDVEQFSYGIILTSEVVGCCDKYFFTNGESDTYDFIKKHTVLAIKQVLKHGIADPDILHD